MSPLSLWQFSFIFVVGPSPTHVPRLLFTSVSSLAIGIVFNGPAHYPI